MNLMQINDYLKLTGEIKDGTPIRDSNGQHIDVMSDEFVKGNTSVIMDMDGINTYFIGDFWIKMDGDGMYN